MRVPPVDAYVPGSSPDRMNGQVAEELDASEPQKLIVEQRRHADPYEHDVD